MTVDLLEPSSSFRKALHATEASDNVRETMFTVCAVPNIYLNEVMKETKVFNDESEVESMYLILRDAPYNVCRVWENDDSGHDHLSTSDLVDIVVFVKAVMKL